MIDKAGKAGRFLAKPDIMFFALAWLMVILVAGTIAQKYVGVHEAREMFFSAPVLWAGPVPLPGGATTLGVIFTSLSAKLVFASRWSLRNSGILLIHLGGLLLLAGGLVTALHATERTMMLYEGETGNVVFSAEEPVFVEELPFSLHLVDFDRDVHPGTDIPSHFQSTVLLKDGQTEWRAVIRMNEPLRHKGYTFYQSSFIDEGDAEGTILAVVRNTGKIFPYISSAFIVFGLLLHMALRLPPLLTATLVLVLSLSVPGPAHASPPEFDFDAFGRIPVLDQGRVKPVDTLARAYLTLFSGKDHLENLSATEWLAETLFDPALASERPIFKVADPRVADAIGLDRGERNVWSWREIAGAMSRHPEAWRNLSARSPEELTRQQRELVALGRKARMFRDLSRSLVPVFPVVEIRDSALARDFVVPQETVFSFVDLHSRRDVLKKRAKLLDEILAHGSLENFPDESVHLLALFHRADAMSRENSDGTLAIIPAQEKSGVWQSPWDLMRSAPAFPQEDAVFLRLWTDAAGAWRQGDPALWDRVMSAIHAKSLDMGKDATLAPRLRVEQRYNEIQPFRVAPGLYAAGLAVLLLSAAIRRKALARMAFALVLAGFSVHGTGIGMRMFIMSRPPVTDLFESVLFVGAIVVLTGLIYEARTRSRFGLLLAALAGSSLQLAALRLAPNGDTMGMLTAVLDSNFWLAAHVVTITTGYGACLATGLLAHGYLFVRIALPDDRERALTLSKHVRGLSYVALFLTALGTMLGGFWADQSWGRFWGWDPKENGALLICLWLLFLMHGRLSGRMGEAGYNAGMALTNVVVALAWFGVNLLNVGLHSYGFMAGTALWLGLFCALELAVALGSYAAIRLGERKAGTGMQQKRWH
ncbi:MAG: hypothetical protein EOM26_05410 [Alphaproteobacteria bacterium]|nr:hypothetical protein [Alphaproteobacteria bacterium]